MKTKEIRAPKRTDFRCMACQEMKAIEDSQEIHPGKLYPVESYRWTGVSSALVCRNCGFKLCQNQYLKGEK